MPAISKPNWVTSVTVKGQATIPREIRSLLQIHPGKDRLGFLIRNGRVEIHPVVVKGKPWRFTKREWKKIEKITREKGQVFQSYKDFARHLDNA